jgi:3-hydroxyisobutyrate dehydrogenase-like beta-hydroxyacid dehydrogenase
MLRPAVVNTVTLGRVSVMTAAVIGTGGLGTVIARELASGGETLRLKRHQSSQNVQRRGADCPAT